MLSRREVCAGAPWGWQHMTPSLSPGTGRRARARNKSSEGWWRPDKDRRRKYNFCAGSLQQTGLGFFFPLICISQQDFVVEDPVSRLHGAKMMRAGTQRLRLVSVKAVVVIWLYFVSADMIRLSDQCDYVYCLMQNKLKWPRLIQYQPFAVYPRDIEQNSSSLKRGGM